MRRREFITLVGGAVAAWPVAARAEQAGKVYQIGFLGNSTAALEENLVGPFREGLRDLGYVEGQNIGFRRERFLKARQPGNKRGFSINGEKL
jgi:putative ABC transport system substrate-binding protein